VPHMSFVWGDENVEFLRKRYAALQQNHLFKGMEYAEDHAQIQEWIPLIMEGRDIHEPVAATKMDIGTDVNFGALSRCLFEFLRKQPHFKLKLAHEVRDLERLPDGRWRIEVKNSTTK